jgi:hypothetical protein
MELTENDERMLKTLHPKARAWCRQVTVLLPPIPDPMEAAALIEGEVVLCSFVVAMTWRIYHPDVVVVQKDICGSVEVSTVFLGMRHGEDYSPYWFETILFGLGKCNKKLMYQTYVEALRGHRVVVDSISNGKRRL